MSVRVLSSEEIQDRLKRISNVHISGGTVCGGDGDGQLLPRIGIKLLVWQKIIFTQKNKTCGQCRALVAIDIRVIAE
jgi:hypothetical protein